MGIFRVMAVLFITISILDMTHTQCDIASPCFPNVTCIDYDDGYMCEECPLGYNGSTVRGYDLQDATTLQQVCLFGLKNLSLLLLVVRHKDEFVITQLSGCI